ncbi:MAG TPA: glycosyltransferase [Candidatus Acidoferrum sp.]|nr:glycosyltransferase [Candidatus Acidoferrum sp.]
MSVVIPVRDDAPRLRRCLASIRANAYPEDALELIVVDNGSRDDSVPVATAAGAHLLHAPGLKVAALRNAGARIASGDIIAFVDADHVIDLRWLAGAAEVLAQPDVGGTGAAYVAPTPGTWVQAAYDRLRSRPAGRREVDWLGAGNLALRRDVFLALGGFDTSLETCEDVDLCNRLRTRGLRLISDPRLRSVHHGDPATLRGLFCGELWRGRDNLRATLRGPLTGRALPSLLIALLILTSGLLAVLGLCTLPLGGGRLILPGLLGITLLIALRAFRMLGNGAASGSWRHLPQDLAVASAYELARALALVWRATHRTRRGAAA